MNRKNLLTISVQKINSYLYKVVRQPSKRQILYSPIGPGNPEKLKNSIKRISRNLFLFQNILQFYLIKNVDVKIIKRLYNRISWLTKGPTEVEIFKRLCNVLLSYHNTMNWKITQRSRQFITLPWRNTTDCQRYTSLP